jgi:cyclopropane fatty-acyl-phospholipid synthase-like methyltransferase
MSAEKYERKSLLWILTQAQYHQVVFPTLQEIQNESVLELGCGTGRFTKVFYKQNKVVCLDKNPHLFQLKDIPIIKGDATDLDSALNDKKFDRILSFSMTEYLSAIEIQVLFSQVSKHLVSNGTFMCSFVANQGLGSLYVLAARYIRNTTKHSYSLNFLAEAAEKAGMKIIKRQNVKLGFLNYLYILTFQKV